MGIRILRPLLDHLESLFTAAGIAHEGSEAASAFRARTATLPTNRVLARLYERIALAEDPFREKGFRDAIPALGALLRGKWERRGRSGINPDERLLTEPPHHFSQQEIQDVRSAADQLALYHDNLSRNRTKRRDDLDTLLIGLADVFAIMSKFTWNRLELGKGERSRFMQFAHVALTPFLPAKIVSPGALYSRWKRLQKEGRDLDQSEDEEEEKKRPAPRTTRGPKRWKNKRKLTPRI